MFNIKSTPAAITMLPFAVMLDLIGIVLVCFGLDDFSMTDMIGIVFINGWLIFKGGNPLHEKGKKGQIDSIKKLFTDKKSRLFVPAIAELIPYLGCLPFWTITVWLNLSED